MANSDNVLRCGLTPKHVDVDEVLTLTDFTPLPDPRCARAERGDGEVRFEVPVRDFGLSVLDLSGARRSAHACGAGPHIVLCARGSMHVSTADADVRLGAGAAAFVRAGDGAFTVAGDGEAYLVGVGQPPDRQT
jgi:mannose-6-phosphate isomerase